MPFSKRFPTSWRYLKARLRILKRPMVWGSLAMMLLVLGVFAEYWRRSDELFLLGGDRSPSETGVASLDDLSETGRYRNLPSQDDSAIGADIDTLPLLLEDFSSPTPEESEPLVDPSVDPSLLPLLAEPLQAEVDSETGEGEAEPLDVPAPPERTILAPFGSSRSPQSQGDRRSFNLDLPQLNVLSPAQTGTSGSGQPGTQPTLSPSSGSPLQFALERYSSPAPSSAMPGVATPTSPTLNPSLGETPTQPAQPSTPAIPSPPGTTGQLPPLTSPPMGTTGYSLPPSFRPSYTQPGNAQPYNPSYAESFNPTLRQSFPTAPQVNPARPSGNPSAFGSGSTGRGTVPSNPFGSGSGATPQIQAPSPATPFSVPRSIPARPIGNGRINTFGNP